MGLLAKREESDSKKQSVVAEASRVFGLARQSWGLVERRYKVALCAAVGVMLVTSACNTLLPVLLGKLVDQIQTGTQRHETSAAMLHAAVWFLGLMAAAYLVREVFNVVRRSMVAFACASIHRDTSVRLVSHLMKVPLATLAQEQVGALHGRIFRSVDGFVHFLQLNFLDFLARAIYWCLCSCRHRWQAARAQFGNARRRPVVVLSDGATDHVAKRSASPLAAGLRGNRRSRGRTTEWH